MIRRSPCELFIKFLLVHPHDFSDQQVCSQLDEMGLDYPSEVYISRLRGQLSRPSPWDPYNVMHSRSQMFLKSHRLVGFFAPSSSAKRAHDLVKLPRVKELIETMTLAYEPPALTAHLVQQQCGEVCSTETLRYYCAFYWDLNLVDTVEIRALLRMRHKRLVSRTDGNEVEPFDRVQYEALKSAAYKDPRRMVSEMTVAPMAGLMNRLRMGYLPSNVDVSRMAQAAKIASVARIKEAALNQGPNSAAEARDFSVVVRVLSEVISEFGSPDADLQRDLQQLALQTEDFRPPSIHQLSDGNHTVDLQPTVETEVVDAEFVNE